MFLAAAAGSTSRELRIKSPTQEIDRVTIMAIAVVKIVCKRRMEIPLEEAS